MRDLEKSVGMHRRLVGVGKSNPGDDVGTFDFRWHANRHSENRKAVCTVYRGQGWECLNIMVLDLKPISTREWPRAPIMAETLKLLPLFFKPDERPIQVWNDTDDYRMGVQFWLSERTYQTTIHLPKFGHNFSLAKSNP